MTESGITEAGNWLTVSQFPMVRHAAEIGWTIARRAFASAHAAAAGVDVDDRRVAQVPAVGSYLLGVVSGIHQVMQVSRRTGSGAPPRSRFNRPWMSRDDAVRSTSLRRVGSLGRSSPLRGRPCWRLGRAARLDRLLAPVTAVASREICPTRWSFRVRAISASCRRLASALSANSAKPRENVASLGSRQTPLQPHSR